MENPGSRKKTEERKKKVATRISRLLFAAINDFIPTAGLASEAALHGYQSLDRNGRFFFLAFDVAVDFGEDEVGG